MNRKWRAGIWFLLVLLLVAWGAESVFGVGIFTEPRSALARQAYSAGHKALFMCAGVFVAERDPADIREEELAYASPMFNAPGEAKPDPDTQSAVGTALFFHYINRVVNVLFRERPLRLPGRVAPD